MILGRHTTAWVSLITALGGLVQLLLVTFAPSLDPTAVATVIGAVVTFLGVFLAFLANTATTPTADPQLQAGTMVRVTDDSGTVIGHEPVPQPTGAPGAG